MLTRESKGAVTLGNFSRNTVRVSIQAANEQYMRPPLRSLSHNEKLCCELQNMWTSPLLFATLREKLQIVKCILQLVPHCIASCRKKVSCNSACDVIVLQRIRFCFLFFQVIQKLTPAFHAQFEVFGIHPRV